MTQTPVRRSDPSSAPAPLAIRCTRSPGRMGAAWIHLTGELDLCSAPAAAEQLREAQASSYLVVVDLRDLEFIDCAGLGVLVAADAWARQAKRSLVLIRGGGQVDRLLGWTGMLAELEVFDVHPYCRKPILGGRR